jgi:hypothetical protein
MNINLIWSSQHLPSVTFGSGPSGRAMPPGAGYVAVSGLDGGKLPGVRAFPPIPATSLTSQMCQEKTLRFS